MGVYTRTLLCTACFLFKDLLSYVSPFRSYLVHLEYVSGNSILFNYVYA